EESAHNSWQAALLGECQNVVSAAGVATVAEPRKLFKKNAVVFLAMHFADDARTFLLQQALRPSKHFDFRALHVALEKIGRRLRPAVIIQRHRTHLNRVFRFCRNDVTKSAVGRCRWISSREE